jgi:hypothetical protein
VEREPANEVTQLLQDWRGGNRDAFDALLPIVYKELHRLAHFQLRSERVGHSLQSTALVHEASFRIFAQLLFARGRRRSQDSTWIALIADSSYFPQWGATHRFR